MGDLGIILVTFAVLSLMAVAVWVIPWGVMIWVEMHPLRWKSPQEKQSAEQKAELLLAEMLGREAYVQLCRIGYIDVPSPHLPERVYRVPKYRGRIHIYEKGRGVGSLCIQPTRAMPDADVVLMHKLMIEGNEQEYLRKAHHFAGSPVTAFKYQL